MHAHGSDLTTRIWGEREEEKEEEATEKGEWKRRRRRIGKGHILTTSVFFLQSLCFKKMSSRANQYSILANPLLWIKVLLGVMVNIILSPFRFLMAPKKEEEKEEDKGVQQP